MKKPTSGIVDVSGVPIAKDDDPLTPAEKEDFIDLLSAFMPKPSKDDMDKGAILYVHALENGLDFSELTDTSIWATILGLFGAVARLQDQVTILNATVKPKKAKTLANYGGKKP